MEKRNGMLYPMMVIAAISVILFSVVGIATMTGHMPSALSQKSDVTAETSADKSSLAAKDSDAANVDPNPVDKGNAAKSHSVDSLAHSEPRSHYTQPQRVATVCANCGVVESVRAREVKGHGSGLGVVGGAVLGGVLGHQVGNGRGNDLATVAGAVGGGFAGNEVERNMKKSTQYVIRVHMEDNTYRTVTQAAQPGVSEGERVRIENGTVVARG